jgi:CPA2 family monovalent cation:H+ antiporter-2
MQEENLKLVVLLISTALLVVLFFRQLKLSPVLGYFVAGALLGSNGFNYVDSEKTEIFGEIGVVFLLFAIGLELTFERLKAMRKYVFGFGSLQVFITALLVGSIAIIVFNNNNAAILIGGGLALSSTAIVLQVIAESRSQSTQVGRLGLSVLLMQDFAVVPLLVIIPLLSGNKTEILSAISGAMVKAIIALVVIFIAGMLLVRPLFSLITSPNSAENNELFTAATLSIALSSAWLTNYMELSTALGGFVAGILVAETEFQTKAEETIAPFKGLLLGLFFMTKGMQIDLNMLYDNLKIIILLACSIILLKAFIISGLCILFGFSTGVAIHSGLLLSQGSEFAFILFNMGIDHGILSKANGQILLLVVTLTMALTPLIVAVGKRIAARLDHKPVTSPLQYLERGARDLNNHVVIAGFGAVGKIVSKMLEAEHFNYIALDTNADIVNEEAKNSYPIFRGDVSQLQTLKAAGLDRARSIIIAIDNSVTIKKALKVISTNFPEVAIVVRAADLKNASELYENGATIIVPENYESGLQLGGAVLKSIGISEFEISRMKNQFRASNYVMANGKNSSNDLLQNN